jgi:hypothetical protein
MGMDKLVDKNNVVFIIAHKYFRGYESYLQYYINNINIFYKNALILVIDNNSAHKDNIFSTIKEKNVILLDNNIESKFEIGAYTVGLKYLIDNNLINKYNYIVLSQDTFVIKNRLDFNSLYEQDITACPINSLNQTNTIIHPINDITNGYLKEISEQILNKININNNLDKISFCWCSSFIISTKVVNKLFNYFKEIKIINRDDSCAGERYLARILWELNNSKNNNIDGEINNLPYNSWLIDILNNDSNTFFIKKHQHKTEQTIDR